MSGPGNINAAGTGLLVLIPTCVFLFRIGPLLAGFWPWTRWVARPMVAALATASLWCLATAHMMDPGIIPRNTSGEAPFNPNGLRVCSTCNVVKPARSHHCRECQNCVAIFDHHCPWIGNCVAQRNYRNFVGFITITWLLVRALVICVPTPPAPRPLAHCLGTGSQNSLWSPAQDVVVIFFSASYATFKDAPDTGGAAQTSAAAGGGTMRIAAIY